MTSFVVIVTKGKYQLSIHKR